MDDEPETGHRCPVLAGLRRDGPSRGRASVVRYLVRTMSGRWAETYEVADPPRGALFTLTGRFEAERTVIRGGRARRMNFVKRLFGFPELRDWLFAAGFAAVTGYGEDGRPLTADHKRMISVADLP
jgi:hypothetical protein